MNSISCRKLAPLGLLLLWLAATPDSASAVGINPQTCEIQATYDVREEAPVTVDFLVTCAGAVATDATWASGDGSFRQGNPISHTYIEDDSFTVSVLTNTGLAASTVVDIPGFLLLDDLEDVSASTTYWALKDEREEFFLDHLATRLEGSVSNTEFRNIIGDLGDGNDSDNGYNGLIIPGPGGGVDPFDTSVDPFDGEPRYAEGRIGVDFRYKVDWSLINRSAPPPIFEVVDLFGLDAKVVAMATDQHRMLMRLENETRVSPWIALGIGDLDGRLELVLTNDGSNANLQLSWQLAGGQSALITNMDLTVDRRLIGFGSRNTEPRNLSNSMIAADLGYFYLDNFEFTNYVHP